MTTIDSSNNQTTDSLVREILHDATQIINNHSEPAINNGSRPFGHWCEIRTIALGKGLSPKSYGCK